MNIRQAAITGVLAGAVSTAAVSPAHAQAGAETFAATATIKAAGAATANAPITIAVNRVN
jgi:hypothetical protein